MTLLLLLLLQGLICSETSETMSRYTGYGLGFGETALVAWEPVRRTR